MIAAYLRSLAAVHILDYVKQMCVYGGRHSCKVED